MRDPFAPYQLAGVTLRNRFVRSATVSPYAADGAITQAGIQRYRLLARNQVGLIITEMTYVCPQGKASHTQLSLCSEEDTVHHSQITKAVHQEGGKIFLQLNHGGAASLSEHPLSPSGISSPYTTLATQAMTEADSADVTQKFAASAAWAKEAGYDGIQIHCAHGYLLSQFISPYFNRRKDAYGGTPEKRFRFPAEVISAVRAAVGSAYPVCIKINSNAELEQDDGAYEDALMWMGQRCAELGICAIEVSGHDFTLQGRAGHHTYYLKRAARLHASSGLPVMLVGGIRTMEHVQQVLGAGIDLISMSRPFLCQPDSILCLKQGLPLLCTSCSKCFIMLRKFKAEGRLCVIHEQGADVSVG